MITGFKAAPAALLLALALCTSQDHARAAAGPFAAAMAGSWSGGGMLTTANGMQERLRCRASYRPGGDGNNLDLSLQCASDSYNFSLAGNVSNRDGAISGSWSEASRNASGTISGEASGDSIRATARGDNFSAGLSVTTQGNRQSVTLTPQGTDVRSVSVTLAKR
jgi:hypothetical protein